MTTSVLLVLGGVGLHAVAGYFQFGRLNRYGVEEFSNYWGFLGKKGLEWVVKSAGSVCIGLGVITGIFTLLAR